MKSIITRTRAAAIAVAAVVGAPQVATADTLSVTSLAPGYTSRPIELGVSFGGAIAVNPAQPDRLFVSAGNFSMHTILEVRLDTGTTRTVTPHVGNVGGMAFLANGDLAITDNDDFSSDTVLRARDLNLDGDWLELGEITELIQPILTMNFSGAQLAVAPSGNAAAIPTGSLLVQTADGGPASEILVVEQPETSPAYRPAGSAFYSGFTYNGGIAFSPEGHVLCGVSDFPTGRVTALVNTNSDSDIDPGESHDILTAAELPFSISDISASTDGNLVVTENSGAIRLFDLPANLLTGSATEKPFAQTNGSYLSSARLDFPTRTFSPGSTGPKATLYVGGFVSFRGATNLLAITPVSTASAEDWQLFQ